MFVVLVCSIGNLPIVRSIKKAFGDICVYIFVIELEIKRDLPRRQSFMIALMNGDAVVK